MLSCRYNSENLEVMPLQMFLDVHFQLKGKDLINEGVDVSTISVISLNWILFMTLTLSIMRRHFKYLYTQ